MESGSAAEGEAGAIPTLSLRENGPIDWKGRFYGRFRRGIPLEILTLSWLTARAADDRLNSPSRNRKGTNTT
jgi:hypothetical protein